MIYLIVTVLLGGIVALAWQNGKHREQYKRLFSEAELLRKRNDAKEEIYRNRPVNADDVFNKLLDHNDH